MNAQFDHSPKEKNNQKRSAENVGISMPSTILVHAQLEMTNPGDSDEQEADEMADSIVNGGKIARSVSIGHSGSGITLPSKFGSQLASLQGQGSRLYGGLKSQMESGFGRDFSDVRIHTGHAAAEMSDSISARAFTYGNDIFFNRGQYSPDTRDGQRLIAHELTHVTQGTRRIARQNDEQNNSQRYDKVKDRLEQVQEAEQLAQRMIMAALGIIDAVRPDALSYFFGTKTDKESIRKVYNSVNALLNNDVLDSKDRTVYYNFSAYKGEDKDKLISDVAGRTVGGLFQKDKEGRRIYLNFTLKKEDNSDNNNEKEAFVTPTAQLALTIVHEFTHAALDGEFTTSRGERLGVKKGGGNDNVYYDSAFATTTGYQSESSKPNKETADSYANFAYLATFTPFILTNNVLRAGKVEYSLYEYDEEKDEMVTNTYEFEKGFVEKGLAVLTNFGSGKKMSVKALNTYHSVFNGSSLDNNEYKWQHDSWNNITNNIKSAPSIKSIEAIQFKDIYMQYSPSKNEKEYLEFTDRKYQEYIFKLMKNQLSDKDILVLYWLSHRANNPPDVRTKAIIRQMAEKVLAKK